MPKVFASFLLINEKFMQPVLPVAMLIAAAIAMPSAAVAQGLPLESGTSTDKPPIRATGKPANGNGDKRSAGSGTVPVDQNSRNSDSQSLVRPLDADDAMPPTPNKPRGGSFDKPVETRLIKPNRDVN